MNAIKKIFDSQRKHFTGEGRLKSLKPLFDATEAFFFLPGVSAKTGPFVRDSLDLKRYMSLVIIALLPPLFSGIYITGYQSNLAAGEPLLFIPVITRGLWIVVPIIAVSYGVGFFWEILFASVRRHSISEGFLVTGLLFPLTLPPTIPLWQVAMGITFGVVIGKEIFGGTGRNIFNPALTGRAFLFFAYPSKMSGDSVWVAVKAGAEKTVDAITSATPLALTSLTPPFEKIESVLEHAGYTFPTLFAGNYPGTIGGTSVFCCLIGAMILISTGIASFRIIAGGVIGMLITGILLNLFATANSLPWQSITPLYHLLAGGFSFGIVYMATDPVSSPGMETARWVYGFLIGMLTVLIRVFNPAFPEGVMMAILFMNLFAPLLDHLEITIRLKKRIPNV